MTVSSLAIQFSCIALALLLFLVVNWIGRHAISFGYSSTTLFEDPDESLALNFLIRTLPPAVFIVLLSAGAVASGNDELRLQSYWIAIYYYALRAAYFPTFGLHRLINWWRFILHSVIGIVAAFSAFYFLILPKNSLLPDLETAGNELWLAMLVFVYAVGNNIVINDTGSWARRNSYVRHSFHIAQHRYGGTIDKKISDDLLKLVAYAIIIFEGYCRPPIVRAIERAWPWKSDRTTGIMQVASSAPLSDEESVDLGVEILLESWQRHLHLNNWERVQSVLADYNRDDGYIYKVEEVMGIIAKRVEPYFLTAHESLTARSLVWEESSGDEQSVIENRPLRLKKARFSQVNSPRRRVLRYRRTRLGGR